MTTTRAPCNCGFESATEKRTLPLRTTPDPRSGERPQTKLTVVHMCGKYAEATDQELARQGYGRDYYETMRRQQEATETN